MLLRFNHAALALCLLAFAGPLFSAETWSAGARVIVEKAGAGHRAIVLRTDATRVFVAYEGEEEVHDEWVEVFRIRGVRPLTAPDAPASTTQAPGDGTLSAAAEPMPVETLPHSLELPRASRNVPLAEAWLEQLPRENADAPARFNTARLVVPRFSFGEVAGIPTARGPVAVAPLHSQGRVRGFAAIEQGVALYTRDEHAGFVRVGELDLKSLAGFKPELLLSVDLNHDGESDLVVVGGPVVQVFFGSASGVFVPAVEPYRATEPVTGVAAGKFFTGPLPTGLAIVEGFNLLRLLTVTRSGLQPSGEPFEVKFDRVTKLVAGDFDGDGFSDLAVATEHRGRPSGVWMYFNQRGATKPFLWPVGGRDDFARDLCVADLDRDGRDDLIITDGEVERGERVRVFFGSAGRAGWEDSWELVASEYGVGLGTASIVVGDFNRDGRLDIGVGGRNGLRVYLGADYRRFSRNPIWPQLASGGDFPEQRSFVAADFDGDGATDLLGFTPVFATGYNLLFNATPLNVADAHVPAPLQKRQARQASTTTAKVEGATVEVSANAAPQLRFLASRAEPYGQWRYRIVVEVAALHTGVVQSVDAVCKYEALDQPLQQLSIPGRRESEQQWSAEIVLPRGRAYEFTFIARDDKGRESEPLRVTVAP